MELVHRHLSSKEAEPWSYVVHSADNLDLVFGSEGVQGHLCKYFLSSANGLLLLTTCFSRVAQNFTLLTDTIES